MQPPVRRATQCTGIRFFLWRLPDVPLIIMANLVGSKLLHSCIYSTSRSWLPFKAINPEYVYYMQALEFEITVHCTYSSQVLTARSICSEEWATSMNWKSMRQPDIDIYRWSSGAQEGGGVMGVTLHPGPFSIHQERCMDRLNVRTRSESWQTERDRQKEVDYILRQNTNKEQRRGRLNMSHPES